MSEQVITLHVVEGFRNRTGHAVVARLAEADGSNVREYELTRQFPDAHGAMDALAKFLRVQTVEQELE